MKNNFVCRNLNSVGFTYIQYKIRFQKFDSYLVPSSFSIILIDYILLISTVRRRVSL